ncbi:MAG: TrkH family potassium uptake protein, partial [Phormidesmis sp.]
LTALFLGPAATPTVATFADILNALFESFSGFTSAGLTMTLRPSELPACLQWWRSFMQWVGGVGIIVLTVALMQPAQDQYVLYQAEGRQERIRLTVSRSVRRIWIIYLGYTGAGTLLFRTTGMTWWEALNHSMCAIATGGFSITDGSMGAYGVPAKLAIIAVMVCGAVSFSTHDQLLVKRNFLTVLKDRQHLLLIALLIVGSIAVGLEHYTATAQFAWIDSAFQWVSALSTCGFSTQSLQFLSSTNKLLLSMAMVIGGAAGSTVGGLKVSRVLALIEAVVWRFRRTGLSPRQIVLRRIDGQPLTPEQASRQIEDASALALLWLIAVVIGTLLLLRLVPSEYTLSDVIFEVTSALGAAGLSVGITGPALSWLGKSLLIFMMWMGRLEIVPVLMLLSLPLSWFYNLPRR